MILLTQCHFQNVEMKEVVLQQQQSNQWLSLRMPTSRSGRNKIQSSQAQCGYDKKSCGGIKSKKENEKKIRHMKIPSRYRKQLYVPVATACFM